MAAASAQCSCLTYTMRHPSSDKREAQFMLASPSRAKHVRTPSCAKALARTSYRRGLDFVLHRRNFRLEAVREAFNPASDLQARFAGRLREGSGVDVANDSRKYGDSP